MPSITFGVLTISDSCFENNQSDKSGPILKHLLTNNEFEFTKILKAQIQCSSIVPDDEYIIMETLINWSDKFELNVILTTGGTGFSPRDVTPEATKKVINKEAPGFTYALYSESFKFTPMALLSRAVCGIRGKTLIINLPGSPKAAKECFNIIAKLIPHAVDLILNNQKNVQAVHYKVQHDFQHDTCSYENSKAMLDINNVADRPRESPFPVVSLDKSLELITISVEKEIPSVEINIWESFGRVLSKTVKSHCNLPPFRASMKDGYAVIVNDGKGQRNVLGGLETGHQPGSIKLTSGNCVRINTGAPVPDEATAVVQVEDTELIERDANGKEEKKIEILFEPVEGQDIRPIGSDIMKDSAVLKEGTKIGAVEMGILAACGFSKIHVTYIPKIGVLSTGNELQNPGEILKPGHIYDSNRISLIMLLKENGYSAIDLGIATDKKSQIINAMEEALKKVDLIITTGSVSMGDQDMLKPILIKVFKANIHFGRVHLKPGKPTTYATCNYNGKKKYFMCLPGNPVSAVVTMNIFVFPLLNCLTKNNANPAIVKAKVMSKYVLGSRPEFARVVLEWADDDPYPKAFSTGNQISSKLLNCKNANALLMLPEESAQLKVLEEGSLISAMLIGFNQYTH